MEPTTQSSQYSYTDMYLPVVVLVPTNDDGNHPGTSRHRPVHIAAGCRQYGDQLERQNNYMLNMDKFSQVTPNKYNCNAKSRGDTISFEFLG